MGAIKNITTLPIKILENTRSLILFIFIMLNFSSSYAQVKEVYLNDDFKIITKAEFEKKLDNEFDYTLRFESDSSFVNIKVTREKKGKIKQHILDSIKSHLLNKSNKKTDAKDLLVINYYQGNDACSTPNYKKNFRLQYRKYHKQIDKIKNVKQFFIYKSTEKKSLFGSQINWFADTDDLIENTFFPIPYPCSGYVIIDHNGNYFSQRGEYSYSKKFVEDIKIFADKGIR